MLRIPHIRKHTPQSSRQTKRGVHKRASPCQQRHTSKAPTAPHRHNVQPGTIAAYRHKSIPFRPSQSSTLKKARGVCRGSGASDPLLSISVFFKKTTISCRILQYPLSSVHADLPLCRHPQVPYPPSYQPPQNKHPV